MTEMKYLHHNSYLKHSLVCFCCDDTADAVAAVNSNVYECMSLVFIGFSLECEKYSA